MLKKFFITIFFFVFLHLNLDGVVSDWTILIYMQADNDVCPNVFDEINSWADYPNFDPDVTVLIQVNASNKIYRYCMGENLCDKDNKKHLNLLDTLDCNKNNSPVDYLENFVSWGVKNYSAEKYILTIWGEGEGPVVSSDIYYPQPVDLNIKNLKEALSRITKNNFNKCKIDVLYIMSCFMGSIEVAYQVKDYVDYLVVSESNLFSPNYYYGYNFLNWYMYKRNLTPLQATYHLVRSFYDWYVAFYNKGFQWNRPWYVQSAYDLSKIDVLYDNINSIADHLIQMKSYDNSTTQSVLSSARDTTLNVESFYKMKVDPTIKLKGYLDLGLFFKNLNNQINIRHKTVDIKLDYCFHADRVQNLIQEQQELFNNFVVSSSAGGDIEDATGCFIYFQPIGEDVHYTYSWNDFAKNKWYDLLLLEKSALFKY